MVSLIQNRHSHPFPARAHIPACACRRVKPLLVAVAGEHKQHLGVQALLKLPNPDMSQPSEAQVSLLAALNQAAAQGENAKRGMKTRDKPSMPEPHRGFVHSLSQRQNMISLPPRSPLAIYLFMQSWCAAGFPRASHCPSTGREPRGQEQLIKHSKCGHPRPAGKTHADTAVFMVPQGKQAHKYSRLHWTVQIVDLDHVKKGTLCPK